MGRKSGLKCIIIKCKVSVEAALGDRYWVKVTHCHKLICYRSMSLVGGDNLVGNGTRSLEFE